MKMQSILAIFIFSLVNTNVLFCAQDNIEFTPWAIRTQLSSAEIKAMKEDGILPYAEIMKQKGLSGSSEKHYLGGLLTKFIDRVVIVDPQHPHRDAHGDFWRVYTKYCLFEDDIVVDDNVYLVNCRAKNIIIKNNQKTPEVYLWNSAVNSIRFEGNSGIVKIDPKTANYHLTVVNGVIENELPSL